MTAPIPTETKIENSEHFKECISSDFQAVSPKPSDSSQDSFALHCSSNIPSPSAHHISEMKAWANSTETFYLQKDATCPTDLFISPIRNLVTKSKTNHPYVISQINLLNFILYITLKGHTVSDCAGLSIVLGALMRLSSCAFLHWSAERFLRG